MLYSLLATDNYDIGLPFQKLLEIVLTGKKITLKTAYGKIKWFSKLVTGSGQRAFRINIYNPIMYNRMIIEFELSCKHIWK